MITTKGMFFFGIGELFADFGILMIEFAGDAVSAGVAA